MVSFTTRSGLYSKQLKLPLHPFYSLINRIFLRCFALQHALYHPQAMRVPGLLFIVDPKMVDRVDADAAIGVQHFVIGEDNAAVGDLAGLIFEESDVSGAALFNEVYRFS